MELVILDMDMMKVEVDLKPVSDPKRFVYFLCTFHVCYILKY